MNATVEYAGIRIKIRRALIRDAMRREELYRAVASQTDDVDFYAWRFADISSRLESLEYRKDDNDYEILWHPPTGDDDIDAAYQQWMNLPIEVLDAANRALAEMNAPDNPDLIIPDDADPKV